MRWNGYSFDVGVLISLFSMLIKGKVFTWSEHTVDDEVNGWVQDSTEPGYVVS